MQKGNILSGVNPIEKISEGSIVNDAEIMGEFI